MRRIGIQLFVVLTFFNYSFAQNSIEELGELSPKKFFKDAAFDVPVAEELIRLLNKKRIEFSDLPELKEVGVFSVFIRDNAFRKGQRGGITYNNDESENLLTSGIYKQSLDPVKEILSKLGVNLSTPDEYLDDDDKKNLYDNFSINYYDIPEAKKFGEFFKRNPDAKGSPKGYDSFYTTYEGGKAKSIVNNVGALCHAFSLDALLTIEINTITTNKSILLESVTVVMHSKHPKLVDEGVFLGVGNYAPAKQFAFAEHNGEDVTDFSFTGFDKIIVRMVASLTEYVIDEINSIE